MIAVQVVEHDGWAEVVLNRPDRRNAVTADLVADLHSALDRVEDRADRIVLLRGAGGTFCSGLDLDAFADGVPDSFHESWCRLHQRLHRSPAVFVGAVERYAVNGGAALALASDLMIIGRHAHLVIGEVAIGAPAPMNTAWLTIRATPGVAAGILLTGDALSGTDLERLNLCHQMAEDDDVVPAARRLVDKLLEHPPGSLSAIKGGLRAAHAHGPDIFDRVRSAYPQRAWTPARVTT